MTLDGLGAKVRVDWLAAYLEQPARLVPNTRMPLFDLTAEQAQDLAVFLLRGASREHTSPPTESGSVDEGRRLFAQKGCAHCHRIGSQSKRLDLPSKDRAEVFLSAHDQVEPIVILPMEQQRLMAATLTAADSGMPSVSTEEFLSVF